MGKALIDQDSADRLSCLRTMRSRPCRSRAAAGVRSFQTLLIEQFEQPIGRPSRQRFFAGALRRQQFRGVYPGNADLPLPSLNVSPSMTQAGRDQGRRG